MRQGLHGEVAVGHLLEEFRVEGYHIFHDIEHSLGGNTDHALIGPTGVLNPDRLPVWLKRAPVKLDKDEIHHLVSNLRRQLSGT